MKIKPTVQFSLRSLLALITIGCIALGRWAESARVQRDAVNVILRAGGSVMYDTNLWNPPPDESLDIDIRNESQHSFSIDFFHTVTYIYAFHSSQADEIVSQVKYLPDLSDLELSRSPVTDRGLSELRFWQRPRLFSLRHTAATDSDLRYLTGLRGLLVLDITDTYVTESGVRYIQSALPTCNVDWSLKAPK